jgi:hypothetical protein
MTLGDVLLVFSGLAITFFFLALNAACKPFCTEGLSRLSALTLIAQFITLYGGLVLIVQEFVKRELFASNEEDNTSGTLSVIYGLVYISNAAVCGWPVFQFLLVIDPAQFMLSAIKRASSRNETKQDKNNDSNSDPETLPLPVDIGPMAKQHQKRIMNVPALAELVSIRKTTLFSSQASHDESLKSLDPVPEHHHSFFEPVVAESVDIKEMSYFPRQTIQKSLKPQEQAQPWLDPAVLSNDIQPCSGVASLDSQHNSGHNVLVQV